MNCNNFEAIITDVARDQMLEATLRRDALSHVDECAECRRQLEAERTLTNHLHAFSASVADRGAPAHVEATLLAKFRERAASAQPENQVVVQMPLKVSRWSSWYPQAAAAAVLLMFAVGGAYVLGLRQGQAPQPNASATSKSSKAETIAATPTVPEVATAPAPEGEDNQPSEVADGSAGSGRGRKLSRNEVAALLGTTPPAARRNNAMSVPRQSVRDSRLASTGDEIATDFMPVAYGENLNSIDSGRIVRVEMPRSALAQFGLPVNMDRANERVKADVLIGDDGMARAIRFVR
jgi:hypothetical protein